MVRKTTVYHTSHTEGLGFHIVLEVGHLKLDRSHYAVSQSLHSGRSSEVGKATAAAGFGSLRLASTALILRHRHSDGLLGRCRTQGQGHRRPLQHRRLHLQPAASGPFRRNTLLSDCVCVSTPLYTWTYTCTHACCACFSCMLSLRGIIVEIARTTLERWQKQRPSEPIK